MASSERGPGSGVDTSFHCAISQTSGLQLISTRCNLQVPMERLPRAVFSVHPAPCLPLRDAQG